MGPIVVNGNNTDVDYDYDTIVVGAGVVGLACAYQLTRLTKRRTLLIDQFKIRHSIGSSHGASRIFRFVQFEERFVPLILDAYKEWRALESASDLELLRQNGLVWFSERDAIENRAAIMRRHVLNHEVLTAAQVSKRYPHFEYTSLPTDFVAIYDSNAGTLMADRALKAMCEQFLLAGGTLKEEEKVIGIEPTKGEVAVETLKGRYMAKNIVVAIGGWTNVLLPTLPFQCRPMLVPVYYWSISDSTNIINWQQSPNLKVTSKDGDGDIYLIPCVDHNSAVKVCTDSGVAIKDMDTKDKLETGPDRLRQFTSEHVRQYLPSLDAGRPSAETTCVYALTSDGQNFVFGRHPQWTRSVFLAGPVGATGFMFAPALGRIMALMANGNEELIDGDIGSGFELGKGAKSRSESKL